MNKNIRFEDKQSFISRVESILVLEKKTRKDLCEYLGISAQAFTNWKQQSSLPSVETALKISNYLHVSLEWLINGYITWDGWSDSRPSMVYSRIATLLRNLPENKTEYSDENPEKLHEPLKGIVDNLTLINWREERAIPDPYVLYRIALFFKVTFVFISTGISYSQDQDPKGSIIINGEEISKQEVSELYELKDFKNILKSLKDLPDDEKSTIIGLINKFSSIHNK